MSGRDPGRLLIFIVAYNAEQTIESVLKRIPVELADSYEVEILIIDDSSSDETFARSELARRSGTIPFPVTVLFNPENQGYGGNQKIGFHYAVEKDFDWVALVHGDGQYAPECLPELLRPLVSGGADAVFGSRMLERGRALEGGMPLYKYVGNKVLTAFQNYLLGTGLSEFHSGYRLYATAALRRIPFALNSNDFHFDTEIIIQLVRAGLRICELPIPTFYGDEICRVNGLRYAWNVCLTTLQAGVQNLHIFYDPKFDCQVAGEREFADRIRTCTVERYLLERIRDGSTILLMGAADPLLVEALRNKGCLVRVDPEGLLRSQRQRVGRGVEYLVLVDDELSADPEAVVERLRELSLFSPDLEIITAAGNIAFFPTRLLLLCGRFSYSRRGILSLKHFRLFTLCSLRKLFEQSGFGVGKIEGLPVPYGLLFSSPLPAGFCTALHRFCIRIRRSFFSYQFVVSVQARPSLPYLLDSAVRVAREKKEQVNSQ